MYPELDDIKAMLLEGSYISPEDSKAAETAAHDTAGYIEYLIREQLLTKSLLGQAIAEAYKVPFADLEATPITKEAAQRIPEQIARANRAIFIKESDTVAAVVSDVPQSVDLSKLKPYFQNKKIRLAYTLPEYLESSFSLYEQPLATRFSTIIESGHRVAPEMLDEILKDALSFKASDIHFEPQVDKVVVRFRVDGSLREAGVLPKEYYENILNRIKVESGMRIDEHLAAQDGAIQRRTQQYSMDLRVSLIPVVQGEKVVMRVLSSYVQSFSLNDIGLSDQDRALLETAAAKPFGMILTVGPTGSGKTTTLYAILKLLNRPNVNVTTIEDPVEYKMSGVNQIQVREQSNMTFAKGLRAIVRQDPDIILVGEIRDVETAEIGVNAALTGHLLLSTFHANDAATAIPRLIDMGIEPFLLASTLELVVAQRLARRICDNCRYSLSATDAIAALPIKTPALSHYFDKTTTVYAGKGCNVCNGTGFLGRIALFEFIQITPEMQELMLQNPSTLQIEQLAHSQGTQPMFQDGINKAKSGLTTLSELVRVVEPPHKKA